MPAPTLTGPAERLYDWLSPWTGQDTEGGYAFAWLAALSGPAHEDLESVIRAAPSGLEGWVRLFNVTDSEDCPDFALPWVAQFPGYQISRGEAPATTRLRLRPDANKKATTGAMVAAVKPHLTGSNPTVRVIERDPTAYRHTLITLTTQTPDPDAVVAVLNDPTVKAVGHWWTHIVSDDVLIDEGTLLIDDVAVDIDDVVFSDVT